MQSALGFVTRRFCKQGGHSRSYIPTSRRGVYLLAAAACHRMPRDNVHSEPAGCICTYKKVRRSYLKAFVATGRGASARYAWLQIALELSYVDITGEDGVEPYATNLHLCR